MGVYESAVTEKIKECVEQDFQWMLLLSTTQQDLLMEDVYPKSYQNALFQLHRKNLISLNDAYCFAQMNTLIYTGKIAVSTIFVDKTPEGNSSPINAYVLENLQSPFFGFFDGSPTGAGGGSDGNLGWKLPINGAMVDRNNQKECGWSILPPGEVPVEVGTVSSEKMLYYMTGMGVARWPYGSKYIYIFYPSWLVKTTLQKDFHEYVSNVSCTIEDSINAFELWDNDIGHNTVSRINRVKNI